MMSARLVESIIGLSGDNKGFEIDAGLVDSGFNSTATGVFSCCFNAEALDLESLDFIDLAKINQMIE